MIGDRGRQQASEADAHRLDQGDALDGGIGNRVGYFNLPGPQMNRARLGAQPLWQFYVGLYP